ncbi:MAG: hypothetical protein GY696_16565, partial [Gammaproteobacteria bacterium]|nr:hypothetical protein [Gammaproteobacteria bacterium]
MIAKVQQSKKELKYGEEMRVVFIYSSAPKGKGFKRDYQGSVKEHKENHAGHGSAFITIKNQDNSCCARAIITAKAKVDKDPKYDTIRHGDHGRKTKQKRLALDLMEQAGVNPDQACGFPEIGKMRQVLGPLYQIKVWDRFRELLFSTESAIKVLHLYLDEGHYDVIGGIIEFHNTSYFCELCDKPYKRIEDHQCSEKCPDCRQSPPCCFNQWIYCKDCNRNFRSQSCYDSHQQQKTNNNGGISSICQRLKRCDQCGALMLCQRINEHLCGYFKCKLCGEQARVDDHLCFMAPTKPADSDVKPTFIVFDLETQQCKEHRQTDLGPMYLHEPNLCIAYKFCDGCKEAVLEHRDFTSCIQCGPNWKMFEGVNTMRDFGKWLYVDNKGKKNSPVIAIAHNARGFDAQFLVNYLAERGYRPKVTPKGQEIMQLEASMVIVKDSLNFLPMSL